MLWYKDGLGKPLYSFDLRGDIADPDGKIWASAEIGGALGAILKRRLHGMEGGSLKAYERRAGCVMLT